MIYEIFNAVDGRPAGRRFGLERVKQTLDRLEAVTIPGVVYDYLPGREGYYVLDMRDAVKAGPFVRPEAAKEYADFEDMCSDTNSFRVYRQEL